MIYAFANKSKGIPSKDQIEHAVKRNFGGLEEMDIWKVFEEKLQPFISDKVTYELFFLSNQLAFPFLNGAVSCTC